MDREALWDKFTDLVTEYAEVTGDVDLFAFTSAMHRAPTGAIADPAYEKAYYNIFPDRALPDFSDVLRGLARFVDEEIVGWWKIGRGRLIADDLRAVAATGEAEAEPLRSWLHAVRNAGPSSTRVAPGWLALAGRPLSL